MHSRRRAAASSRRDRASSARSRSTITPLIIITCSLNSRITRSASWYSAFASSASRSSRSTSGIRLWASTNVKRFAMSRRLTQRGRRHDSAGNRGQPTLSQQEDHVFTVHEQNRKNRKDEKTYPTRDGEPVFRSEERRCRERG